jgi:hypothetical protein
MEFHKILSFVGLDERQFDIVELGRLPIYGSSTQRGGEKDVHWEAVERTQDFNPLGRAAGWSKDAIDRFDWLTRSVSASIGYDMSTANRSAFNCWWHQIRDLKRWLPWRIQERLRYQPHKSARS